MAKQGPKTEEGKAIVRLNAVQHGVLSTTPVIPDLEREEDWDAHRAGMVASLAPQGYLEATLAERIALLLWRLQRVARYESDAIASSQERVLEDLRDRLQRSPYVSSRLDSVQPEDSELEMRFAQDTVRGLALLREGKDGERLSGDRACGALIVLAKEAGIDLDEIEVAGVPDDVEWEDFSGWTVGLVRQAAQAIATQAEKEFADLCEAALEEARVDFGMKTIYADRVARERETMRRERLLPDEDTLNKVIRYEAHLHRQLLQTMHELEALQARRQGLQAPLARVDVQGILER